MTTPAHPDGRKTGVIPLSLLHNSVFSMSSRKTFKSYFDVVKDSQ